MSAAYPKHMRPFPVNIPRSLSMIRLHSRGDGSPPRGNPLVVFTWMLPSPTKVPAFLVDSRLLTFLDVLLAPLCSRSLLIASCEVLSIALSMSTKAHADISLSSNGF